MIKGLYAIIDTLGDVKLDPVKLARDYLLGGAKVIQLREKIADYQTRKKISQSIIQLKNQFDFIFIVNDDPELALEVDVDGVHLGQEDMSVSQARKILGKSKIIGLSSHSFDEASQALKQDINYLAVGAIFKTVNKPDNHPVVGLDVLKKIRTLTPLPLVAIGGITKENFQSVVLTGVDSIALISALSHQNAFEDNAKYFVDLFAKSVK